MKNFTFSINTFVAILVGVGLVAGLVGFKISESNHKSVLNDYLRLAGQVNQQKTDLGTCQASVEYYKGLYQLNR